MLFEYSATNRATCRAKDCKKKIDKDVLRVGEEYGENPYTGAATNIGFRHWGCMTAFLFKKIKTEGGARAVKGFDTLSYEDQNMVLKRCKEPLNPPRLIEAKGAKEESYSPTPTRESTAGTSKAGSSKADSVSGAKSKAKKRKREEKQDSAELTDGEKETEEEEEEKPKKKKKKTTVRK